MARRMTVVFEDEDLYTALNMRSARTHRPAKEIVATALEPLFALTPEEQDTIATRARKRTHARGGPGVVQLLQELGLKR